MNIDPKEFLDYRFSADFIVFSQSTLPQPLVPKPDRRTPADTFQKSLKIDSTAYPTLKTDAEWDSFNRSFRSTARVHNLLQVLDPTYVPQNVDESKLFEKQQAFMYDIFVNKLQTNTGKSLVRKHQATFDAQQIWAELADHCTTSVAADTQAADLLVWLTTKKLTKSDWPGKHHAFILHWLEQARLYNETAVDKMADSQLRVMLANAIGQTPYLRSIKDSGSILSAQTGKPLTYSQYVVLVKDAALSYDTSMNQRSASHGTLQALFHDSHSPPNDDLADFITHDFDLDVDHRTISAFQASSHRTPRPRLDNDTWQKLDDQSRRNWHQFSPEAQAIILKALPTSSPGRPPPPPPPPRRVNLHDISVADFLAHAQSVSMGSNESTLTPAHEPEVDPSTQLLAYLTKMDMKPGAQPKPPGMPPGTLQRVMSDDHAAIPQRSKHKQAANTHEFVLNGVTYRSCNNHTIISSIQNAHTRKHLALIDRGANGGIAGDDARIISKTNRTVDVQGIDNHQVTDIPIVTSAGYVHTQRGPAIAIMHQQAYIGKGQSILSSGQMEHFKITVDDKSAKVGGQQRLTTPDGFVLPLDVRNGLPYLRMRPPTDRELSNPDIPHVVLTSDTDWDPSVLDHQVDDMEAWANSIPDYDSDDEERPFDLVGILKNNKTITSFKESKLDKAIEFFQNFNIVLPTDGLYEQYPRESDGLSWFDCNMADLFGFDTITERSPVPECFEVYEARKRPSAFFDHGQPIVYDIESAPLQDTNSIFKDLVINQDKPTPRRSPRNHSKQTPHGESNRRPPPRVDFDIDPTDSSQVYDAASPQTKQHERDWEKLRQYFAWLPKLVIQKTFDCTTQYARIPMSAHLQRHFRSPFPALNVHRRDEPVATDTVYADTPDIEHGHVAAQFFVGTRSLVSDLYGVSTDGQFLQTLQDNVRKRGAPTKLVSDRAQAQTSKAVQDYLRWLFIDDWQSEPHRQNQNPAERRYQDIKRLANRVIDRTGAPPRLWLLALRYASFVYNHSAVESLGWLTPIQVLTGTTPDISVLLRFSFYEKVYFKTEEPSFPSDSPESIGYMVGIAEHVGHAMTYKVLDPKTNTVLFRSELRSAQSPTDPNKRLDASDGEESTPPTIIKPRSDKLEKDSDENLSLIYDRDEKCSDDSKALTNNRDLIGRTFLLEPDEDGYVHRAKIVDLIEKHEENTTSRPEHIQFRISVNDDEYEDVMAYNEILERLEADQENPTVWKFKRIAGHQGPLHPNHPSYMGCKYNVTMEWENGEITPEPLSVIAKDDPVACAIYARDNNLLELDGWKRFKSIARRQKKLLRMVNQAKLRSFRTAPKYMYGFEIPKDYNDALRLDRLHGNTKWQDCTKLEMDQLAEYNVFVDIGKGAPIPKGYQKIRVHLVYACKHDGRHKARLVADGHLTDVPVDSVYSGVVSIRGLKLMIFLAELNDLDLWATDIGNAYLEAYTTEKVAIIAGPEFGELEGHTLLVSRALYGLRMSGKMWHQRLSACLEEEGFFPCKAEPDIWMRPTPDGKSYEYVGVYVDDLALAMQDPKSFLDKFSNEYKFKLKGSGPLDFHLGCDFFRDEHGVLCMSPRKYIDRMVDTYQRMFGQKPKTNVTSPLEKGDHPECDTSELLDEVGVTRYQSLVGQLQWTISLGRMDITTAVMTISSFRSAPRKGHLDRAKRICGYLMKMKNAAIRFRTGLPDYSDVTEPVYDWADSVYGCPVEQVPSDAPRSLGKPVILTHYVDANLFHCMLTGRSVTGILHLINGTPIDAFSKKQSTVETATYGSEFVAARTCVEQIMDLRFTLRYLGVPIQGRSYMFGDNESVVNSSSRPDARMHKRHVALSFHRVREAIASNMIAFIHIDGVKNLADILSKHWGYQQVWPQLRTLLFKAGDTADVD
jgi:transposase InsO family protein